MTNKTLWIFGDSHCLPYGLADPTVGWEDHLARMVKAKSKNFAEPGCDNLFIFSSILDKVKKFKNKDVIVVGWSHPSRKSFIRETGMSYPLAQHCISYTAQGKTFFRSKGSKANDTLRKWFSMKPKQSGVEYFDRWFKDYYNIHEQKINFTAYLRAVDNLLANKKYLPFYFSKDSVESVTKVPKLLCQAEFIAKHNVAISKDDGHLNAKGHKLWAETLYRSIRSLQ